MGLPDAPPGLSVGTTDVNVNLGGGWCVGSGDRSLSARETRARTARGGEARARTPPPSARKPGKAPFCVSNRTGVGVGAQLSTAYSGDGERAFVPPPAPLRRGRRPPSERAARHSRAHTYASAARAARVSACAPGRWRPARCHEQTVCAMRGGRALTRPSCCSKPLISARWAAARRSSGSQASDAWRAARERLRVRTPPRARASAHASAVWGVLSLCRSCARRASACGTTRSSRR